MVSLLISQPHWLNETFSAGWSPCQKLVFSLIWKQGQDLFSLCCFQSVLLLFLHFWLWVGDLGGCGHLPPLPCRVGPGGIPVSVVLSVGCQLRLKFRLARASQETGGAGRSAVVSEVTSPLMWERCSGLWAACQWRNAAFTNAWFMVRLPCLISIFKSFYPKTSNLEGSKQLRDMLWITAEFKRILQHLLLLASCFYIQSSDRLILLPASCWRCAPGQPGSFWGAVEQLFLKWQCACKSLWDLGQMQICIL